MKCTYKRSQPFKDCMFRVRAVQSVLVSAAVSTVSTCTCMSHIHLHTSLGKKASAHLRCRPKPHGWILSSSAVFARIRCVHLQHIHAHIVTNFKHTFTIHT